MDAAVTRLQTKAAFVFKQLILALTPIPITTVSRMVELTHNKRHVMNRYVNEEATGYEMLEPPCGMQIAVHDNRQI